MMKLTPTLALLLLGPACCCIAAEHKSPERAAAADGVDRDSAEAASQLTAAEAFSKSGDLSSALRSYQRAWRWDPTNRAPLEAIVPLAARLGRTEEAVRYALIDAEAADRPLLRRLALHAAEGGEWATALRLYRLWLAESPPTGDGAANQFATLLIQLEIARLEYLVGEIDAASRSFEKVQSTLLAEGVDAELAGRLHAANGGSAASFWEIFGRCHWEAGRPRPARTAIEQMARSPDAAPRAHYWFAEIAFAEGRPLVAYDLLGRYFDAGGEELGEAPYQLLRRVLLSVNDRVGLVADLDRLGATGGPYALAACARAAEEKDPGRAEALYRRLLAVTAGALRPTPLTASNSPPRPRGLLVEEGLRQHAAAWLIRRLAADRRLEQLPDLFADIGATAPDLNALKPALTEALANQRQADLLVARLSGWSPAGRTRDELAVAAWTARQSGRLPLAAALHEEEIRRAGNDGPRRRLEWALGLLLEDEFALAAEAIQRGMIEAAWSDDNATPLFYLATALALAKDYDAALEAARDACFREPDSAEIAERIAWIHFQAGDTSEAASAYEQLIGEFGADRASSTRRVLKDARLTLSYLRSDTGDLASAVELLEQVLDEFPEDPGALNDLAYLWAERGEHVARAERMARQAVASEPANAAYLDTLGWALFKRGAAEEALTTITRAISLAESAGEAADGEILEHQGDILAALSRPAEATAAWRRAAEAYEAVDATDRAKLVLGKPRGADPVTPPAAR